MRCEMCDYNATFYGGSLRYFECLMVCLLCYLDVREIPLDSTRRADAERTFFLDLGAVTWADYRRSA